MSIVSKTTKRFSTFDPRNIPGCALWLDANDTATVGTSGSRVTSITDKVRGSVFSPQGQDTGRLTYVTQINGRRAMYFNNFDGNFVFLLGALSNITSGTSFVVFQAANLSAQFRPFFTWAYTGSANFPAFGYAGSTVGPYTTFGGTGSPQTSVTVGSNYITHYTWGGTTTSVSFNGATPTAGTQAGYSSTASNMWVGNDNNSMITTYLGEIILFNIQLTTQQRQQVEGYLAYKWGMLGNIPAVHPFKTVRPFTRGFAPIDISGCVLWLDAADSTTLTLSGTNVTTWADKSGNSNNATAAGTTPTYVSASNAISFGGAGNYTTNYSASLSNESLFVVFRVTSSAQEYHNLVAGNGSGSRSLAAQIINNKRLVANSAAVANGSFGPDNSIDLNITYIGELIVSSGTQVSYVTGGSQGSSAAVTYTGGRTSVIGAAGSPAGTFLTGQIYEIVGYSNALSTSQRQQVEGYLAYKWRLRTNIPSTHPFKLYNALTPMFTPVQISGCVLWLDAADATTVTLSGSNITRVIDKSPSNVNLSNATGFTYTSNGFNGRPSFSNTSTSGGRNLGSNTSFNISTPLSVFFVGSKVSASDAYVVDGYLNTANRVAVAYLNAPPSSYFMLATSSISTPSTWAGSNLLISSIFNGASSVGYLSGTSVLTGNTGTNSFGGIIIGSRFSLESAWDGQYCELIIYSGALSTSDRQAVEGYLAAKWGLLNNLPASHPYKKFRP